MRKLILAIVMSALAHPAMAADVEWEEVPAIVMPGRETGTERVVEEGDFVIELPLRWALSVRLERDVTVMRGDDEFTFASGSLLPKVRIGDGAFPDDGRFAFCTRSQLVMSMPRLDPISNFGFGLLASAMDGQTCLEDRDNDGMLDHAIALGEGGDNLRDLGVIPPLAYEELFAEPMDVEEDALRISLKSVRQNRVRFEFGLLQHGDRQRFDGYTFGGYDADRYFWLDLDDDAAGTMQVMGFELQLIETEHRDDRATIRWSAAVASDEVLVVPDKVSIRSFDFGTFQSESHMTD